MIVSLGVGIVVTVLAGFFPALRATRVPPIAAMREGVQIPPRPLPTRRTLIVRFVVGLVVIFALGALSGGHVVFPVLAIAWCLRAARLWARLRREGERPPRHHRVVPALAGAIGWLVSWRGITARLARENSIRQPGRTLVTALALTVGLGLVAFISVLAAGTNATIDRAVNRSFAGNLIVQNTQGQGGVPAAVAPALGTIHGVGAVTAIAFTKGTGARPLPAGCAGDRRRKPRHRDRTRIVREDVQDRMGTRLGGDARGARAGWARSSRRSSRAPTTCAWGSACRC